MDDAERMRLGEGFARLEDVLHRLRDWDLAALLHELGEVLSLEELHDHVGEARGERPDVEDSDDVLALHLHGGARLAREARLCLGQGGHIGAKELDRDGAVELQVAGDHDDAHAADAEEPLDLVLVVDDLPDAEGDGDRLA